MWVLFWHQQDVMGTFPLIFFGKVNTHFITCLHSQPTGLLSGWYGARSTFMVKTIPLCVSLLRFCNFMFVFWGLTSLQRFFFRKWKIVLGLWNSSYHLFLEAHMICNMTCPIVKIVFRLHCPQNCFIKVQIISRWKCFSCAKKMWV